ncbi:hypothetical protein QV08_12405 [Gallibacterium salpingitidis]|uniref:Phage tail assembly protein n=1 Tax=Gallibacterium salpingitidis TaxID=505341 RepID=A0AB36E0U6_9PAST|nr:phage tail assembly protein [Gallibacterium salpingitidis]OBX04265.1 hypothetical protein QV08_12405 [Gallibacterium salpingitidis]OBX08352.1 hypothetical protein QV09_09680 [Gallibacterium salpingitidis]
MSMKVEALTNVIHLSAPITLADGTTLEEVKVREALVKDFRRAAQLAKSSEEREIIIIATCCGLTVEDIELIAWKDYRKISTFLFGEDDNE